MVEGIVAVAAAAMMDVEEMEVMVRRVAAVDDFHLF